MMQTSTEDPQEQTVGADSPRNFPGDVFSSWPGFSPLNCHSMYNQCHFYQILKGQFNLYFPTLNPSVLELWMQKIILYAILSSTLHSIPK